MTIRSVKKASFTLIELLVVIMIILVLAGLLFPALRSARLRARISRAQSEAADLSKAWEIYWDVYKDWSGLGASFPMDDSMVAVLAGNGSALNTNNLKLMHFSKSAETRGFLDPWKNPYKVTFSPKDITREQVYKNRSYMSNRKRYEYE